MELPEAKGTTELHFLARNQLNVLIRTLVEAGYQVVGPTIDQGAIVYGEIASMDDLPVGWTDIQEPGKYRLQKREDEACFGYVVGPHSWKKYLFPPTSVVASADRTEAGWTMKSDAESPVKYAFLGVRACEIAAIRIQDQVFLGGPFVDPIYEKRRSSALIIAVNCTQAAATCFCSSMGTGPECRRDFDIALTELSDGYELQTGSDTGREIAGRLPLTTITVSQRQRAAAARKQAEDQITKHMDTDGIRDLLQNNLRHPQWQDVAERCLSCTNCTMVCPTCFCSTVREVPDLTGNHVDRERQWDSCFNIAFSFVNGQPSRNSISSRYRQWMTHKLSTWYDQFGTSGCVGCGRCITWCPVGIDLTQEVAAIRASNASDSDVPAAPAESPDADSRGTESEPHQ